jgi:hypothetical protein
MQVSASIELFLSVEALFPKKLLSAIRSPRPCLLETLRGAEEELVQNHT